MHRSSVGRPLSVERRSSVGRASIHDPTGQQKNNIGKCPRVYLLSCSPRDVISFCRSNILVNQLLDNFPESNMHNVELYTSQPAEAEIV